MTAIKFPKRHADGTFTVRAHFRVLAPDPSIVALVRDYVSAWVRANPIWVRLWRSNIITEERLELAAEFSNDPRVEGGMDGERFVIVFDGRAQARMWKDWMVRLVHEVQKVFSEIKFERFEST